MITTFYGDACIKLQVGDSSIIFNPPSKSSSVKSLKTSAQATLISARINLIEEPTENKDTFIINSPGEYEVNGIFIQSFPSQTLVGEELSNNNIFSFSFDDMSIVNLGLISHTDLDTSFTEHIDTIDILFVPISGNGTLGPSEAYELAIKLQPKVIIPTFFQGVNDPNLKQFLKEAGSSDSGEDKFTVKRKDIAELENNVKILIPQGVNEYVS